MAGETIRMPGSFGGLTRFNEEYESRFTFPPSAVIGFVVFVIVFVTALKIFFPVGA